MKKFRLVPVCLTLLMGFILGSHNGYIALWTEGSPEPKKVFPYRVTALPPADQKALEQGIHIDSTQELARLLEDYLS